MPGLCPTGLQERVGAGFSRARAAKRHCPSEMAPFGARGRLKPAPSMRSSRVNPQFCNCRSPSSAGVSDSAPFADNQRARVSPLGAVKGAHPARRSVPLTARTADRLSSDQRKVLWICHILQYPFSWLVFAWPGFLKAVNRSPSIRVGLEFRTPHALCAKPAWLKPPHLQNRALLPRRRHGRFSPVENC